ncbi:hypothetical protein QFZ65_001927 [Arthrobacter sp. B3I9]|nr:hypothetical protein [Arthrobacter sp. B3I9]
MVGPLILDKSERRSLHALEGLAASQAPAGPTP